MVKRFYVNECYAEDEKEFQEAVGTYNKYAGVPNVKDDEEIKKIIAEITGNDNALVFYEEEPKDRIIVIFSEKCNQNLHELLPFDEEAQLPYIEIEED